MCEAFAFCATLETKEVSNITYDRKFTYIMCRHTEPQS